MDNILEKHLAAALLISKQDEEESELTIPEISQNIIPYYSYKEVGNSNYIKLTSGLLRTETIGFWRNKPVFLHNEEKYVVLENSRTIVRTESLHITSDQIEKYRDPSFLKQKEFNKDLKKPINKIKASVQSKLDPLPTEITVDENKPIEFDSENEVLNHLNSILPKEDDSKNSVISSYINKIKKNDEEGEKLDAKSPKKSISDTSRATEEPKEDSVISSYIKGLKTADNQKEETIIDPNIAEYVKSDKPRTIEDEIFSIFSSKKDDPRIKRFFSYFSDQTKKEVHEINEKYSQQYFAKILETSGGGGTSNSAVDFAKGGTMEGSLTITNNLSVLGTIYLNNKKVFNIGNNVDTEYVLDHNFDTKDLVISIYDSNDEIVLASAKNINLNQTLISFSAPVENIKVVIMR